AVAEQRAAGGDGDEIAEGGDAILQGHGWPDALEAAPSSIGSASPRQQQDFNRIGCKTAQDRAIISSWKRADVKREARTVVLRRARLDDLRPQRFTQSRRRRPQAAGTWRPSRPSAASRRQKNALPLVRVSHEQRRLQPDIRKALSDLQICIWGQDLDMV